MPGDVSARNIEMLEQRRSVRRVLCDGHGSRRSRAARPTALVITDGPIAGELLLERNHSVCQDGIDEQDGLPRTADFVLELDTVDFCFLHVIPGVRIAVTAVTFHVTGSMSDDIL